MRISNKTLNDLHSNGIKVPLYDRTKLKTSIVHIGFGNFHRSHFLTYLDDLLNRNLYEGGVFETDIISSSIRLIDNLRQQDFMYSLRTIDSDGNEEIRINGSITGYANQTTEPDLVNEKLSSPDTKLITLTITEKGYCYRDDLEALDWDNEAIKHDIISNEPPKSAIGCIVKALNNRFQRKLPVTIMSCDNVPENGTMLRTCIIQFAEKKYPDIVDWIKENISFPCTMVDRITPGTTLADVVNLKEKYNIDDACPIHSENFIQWIVEDNFCTNVPDFSKVGALVVNDVKPYELMKIRLLNGSHSALAYPAYMMGHRMVHEAINDPIIKTFIRSKYMEEITATLPSIPNVNITKYKDQLISRFSNPYIADTILRLASDGSKKISNAIFKPLEDTFRKKLSNDAIIFVLALWQFYFLYKDSNEIEMPIDDPKSTELRQASNDTIEFFRIAGLAESILNNPSFQDKISLFLSYLKSKDVKSVITWFLN